MSAIDFERLFLDNLPLIDRIVADTCRRNRLTKEESEDFASEVRIKLIANDYEVLRKFSGRSTLRCYLVTVVQHAYQDHRNHLLGKWRPSAEARRLGPLAVRLDTLLHRDRLSLDEACALVPAEDREEMRRLAGKLRSRTKRRMEDIQQLERLPSKDRSPEEQLLDSERDELADGLARVLAKELAGLSPEDRLLLQLHLEDRVSLASLAKAYCCDSRKLYRRWELLMSRLRTRLELNGYGAGQVGWMFEPDPADG